MNSQFTSVTVAHLITNQVGSHSAVNILASMMTN